MVVTQAPHIYKKAAKSGEKEAEGKELRATEKECVRARVSTVRHQRNATNNRHRKWS